MADIWCLLSVDNNYDQPPNNLVAWWPDKPSLEVLAEAIGLKFPESDDEMTISVVKIWSGEARRIWNTDYRLELVPAGKLGDTKKAKKK